MSDFNLQAKGLFGQYCRIEMFRYGVPNEFFIHKIVSQISATLTRLPESPCWSGPFRQAKGFSWSSTRTARCRGCCPTR